jgi:hypothetical protein
MPQSQQRDHGVAGKTHWLLDDELVPRRPVRAGPLPVLLRHDALERGTTRLTEAAPIPSTDAFRYALGLLAALSIYLLLRGADVGGALQSSLSGESEEGSAVVTATLSAEPRARLETAEMAALRALLGRGQAPERVLPESRPARSSAPAEQNAPKAPKPPTTEEPILPVQPPAPLPAPDPLTLLPEPLQPRNVIEDLERATGLEPATLSLEG